MYFNMEIYSLLCSNIIDEVKKRQTEEKMFGRRLG